MRKLALVCCFAILTMSFGLKTAGTGLNTCSGASQSFAGAGALLPSRLCCPGVGFGWETHEQSLIYSYRQH